MKFPKKSLIDFAQLDRSVIEEVCNKARELESQKNQNTLEKNLGLVFLEPSTRTRCSFELAGSRLGMNTILIGNAESSFQKGETLEDTLLNLEAMGVDLLVVRHGTNESLNKIDQKISVPIVNGGEGVSGHPTQAMLDLFTIMKKRREVRFENLKERILFVGDLIHSRVARSNFELLRLLKIPFGIVGPAKWLGTLAIEFECEKFTDLSEALNWATVVVALRVQSERHSVSDKETLASFIENFQLNSMSLSHFSKAGLLLHPGPVNWGAEIGQDVMKDSRFCVLDQVKNGVYIRAAVISMLMEK